MTKIQEMNINKRCMLFSTQLLYLTESRWNCSQWTHRISTWKNNLQARKTRKRSKTSALSAIATYGARYSDHKAVFLSSFWTIAIELLLDSCFPPMKKTWHLREGESCGKAPHWTYMTHTKQKYESPKQP